MASKRQIIFKQKIKNLREENSHVHVDPPDKNDTIKRLETCVMSLTPSIEVEIPDKEMAVLRKSLEDDSKAISLDSMKDGDSTQTCENAVDIEGFGQDIATAPPKKDDGIHDVAKSPEEIHGHKKSLQDDSNLGSMGDGDSTKTCENPVDVEVFGQDNATAPHNKDDEIHDVADSSEELHGHINHDVAPAKKRKHRVIMKKSYVDFLSEDEDFVWDSTSWKETGDESTSSERESHGKKRKKRKKRSQEGIVGDDGLRKKKKNKRIIKKKARETGKEYKKKDGSTIRAKELQANPCVGKKCGNNCENINEQKRRDIFDYYWSLTTEKRKDWVVAMSCRTEIKRKRCKDTTKRTNTFEYFINEGEGRRRVCQQFLVNTLDVSQRFIYYTLTNATMGIAKADERGKIVPPNKTTETVKLSAVNFIKSLPALPSHYARKDSTRLYLPVEMKNIKNLYRIYKDEKLNQCVDIVSERIFREIFNKDFNLGFHNPKKDKCVKCLRFEGQDISENAEMKNHLEEKDASVKRKECHYEFPKKNPSIVCATFDLQKVLNTPYGKSMLLFYSRKYTVYNLCFYESVTKNGYCYVWGESEGKRGGNEIATIISKYIDNCDQRGTVKSMILYSDSCAGQNKNRMVLAAIHNALLVSKNLETIQMNYLLPGHTEMTVDSIHATIENSVRNINVWAPSQWVTVCQLARIDPKPYEVEALTHDDFKNYEEFANKYFKSNLVGKISKIRVATFKKSTPTVMTVKYSMKEDAREESISLFAKPKPINAKFKSALPITKSKYNDLKKLCDTGVIPKIFHAEFLNFPNVNGRDYLIDTDIEDEPEIQNE